MQVSQIKELTPSYTERIGYNRRLDIISDLTEFMEMGDWIKANNFPCIVHPISYNNMSMRTIYINEQSLTMFLLRWA